MRYVKPEIETAKFATRVIESRFQKGFEFLLDAAQFLITHTAYESDE